MPKEGDVPNGDDPCYRALRMFDILTGIFETFDEEDDEDKAFCTRAAQVSRSFAEPASNVVWRVLEGLSPLWTVLAPHPLPFRSIRQQEAYISSLMMNKPFMDSARWERFLVCAGRVQVVRGWCTISTEADLVGAIVAHNNGATFLPALRKYAWHQYQGCGTLLASLISRPLQELELFCSWDHREEAAVILPLLPSCSPFLHAIRILRTPLGPAALLNDIAAFKHLRELILWSVEDSLTISELRTLASSFVLETLHTFVTGFEDAVVIDFPTLRRLECHGLSEQLSYFLRSLRLPMLKAIEVRPTDSVGSVEGLRGCFGGISALSFAPSLCKLAMKVKKQLTTAPPVSEALSNLLQPCLGTLKYVEDLSLTFDHPGLVVTCTDDDILLLAQSFPNLRALTIDSSPDYADCPSLKALIHLAQHCPHLATLQFSRFRLCPVMLSEKVKVQCPSLRHFRFRESNILVQNLAGLAKLLDAIFPNVDASEARRHAASIPSLERANLPSVWLRVKALQDYRRAQTSGR